ncbi:MAG TPA: Ig-like domain-containing protein [Geobacteraceae bacterium]
MENRGTSLRLRTWSFFAAIFCLVCVLCSPTQVLADPDGDLDLTGNGVNIDDAILALKISVGLVSASDQDKAQGDVCPQVNGKPSPDGKIDVSDSLLILRKVVGLYNWDLRAEPSPPFVVTTIPANGQSGVSSSTSIVAIFNEGIDSATLDSSTFTVKDTLNNPLSGAVAFSGIAAVFTPSANLSYLTNYTATVSGAVKDLMGNPMGADVSWSFTTGEPPPTYAISGRVATSTDISIPGVLITVSGVGSLSTTTTDSGGNYIFTGKLSGNYSLSALLNGYSFTPPSLNIFVGSGNSLANNFVGALKIDCQVGSWSDWAACTGGCGGIGTQSRFRTIITQPANGGLACPVLTESQPCAMPACPINCEVSSWSAWSNCSGSCGSTGTQSRSRTIITQPANGGLACPVLAESQACQTAACPTITFGTYEGTILDNGVINSYTAVSILADGKTYGVMTSPQGVSGGLVGSTTPTGIFNAAYQFLGDSLKGTTSGTISYVDDNSVYVSLSDYYNGTNRSYTGTLYKRNLAEVPAKYTGTYALLRARVVYVNGDVIDTDNWWQTVKAYFKISPTNMRQGWMFSDSPHEYGAGSYVQSGNTFVVEGSPMAFSGSGIFLTTEIVDPIAAATETDYWVKVSDELVGGTIAYKAVNSSWQPVGRGLIRGLNK